MFERFAILVKIFNVVQIYTILFISVSSQQEHSCVENKLYTKFELDPYLFASTCLPSDTRLRPLVGNGHLSTVAHSQFVFMNGLYNGRGIQSHRAAIPSPLKANVTLVNKMAPMSRRFSLHAKDGIFRETIEADGCMIEMEWYAHRAVLPLLVFDIEVRRSSDLNDVPIHIDLNVSRQWDSPDIDFTKRVSFAGKVGKVSAYLRRGRTKVSETRSSKRASVFSVFHHVPSTLDIESGVVRRRWTFLASIHSLRQEAVRGFHLGMRLIQSGGLRRQHIKHWNATWNNGSIEVEGNATIARAVAASQYYTLSSLPPYEDAAWPFVGLSPSGLAWGDSENYFGHVFWDQETWMYPPILLLHKDLGKLLLNTRVRTIGEAARNAKVTGYRGLRYPWESAFTGTETSSSDTCATQEIHISGDISFAIEQLWWATGDEELFMKKNVSKFTDVVFGIADFWISRLSFNKVHQLFEITHVMPPDEYAVDVNNSVYTNVVAERTLRFASEIAKMLEMPERQKMYDEFASRLHIPFDASVGYHPEYDGYTQGTTVKQADVILLGFPLMWNMSTDVRLKDLETYEKVTSPRGPAMSDSMFAIGWLELKQYQRAVTSFDRMFAHVSGDFQVWTEEKGGGGATNFITGMGGFLQSIIFGFGGVRLGRGHMKLDPVLPPGCTRMLFKSIDYQDSSLSLDIDHSFVTVSLVSQGLKELCVGFGEKLQVLRLHRALTIPLGELVLKPCPANIFEFNSITNAIVRSRL